MLEEVKKEYERRGKPMAFTGWGPEEVRGFMLEHMKKVKKGGDIGLYARMLPKRKSRTEPAPLPQWVTKGKKDETKVTDKGKDDSEDDDTSGDGVSESEEEDGVSDQGWVVLKKKQKYFLQHKATKESVELGSPEEESTWEVKLDEEDGMEYLVQEGATEFEEVSCREFYNEVKAAEKMMSKPPRTRKEKSPAPLVGMKPTAEAANDEGKADDDDFGADDSEEEPGKGDSDDEVPEPIPYVHVDEKDGAKMYLIFPNEVKELKLPTDRCTDWVVVAKTAKGGGNTYWLESKHNEKEVPRDCQVLLQGKKVREISDAERRQKAMALKEDFENKKKAGAASKLEEEKDKAAEKAEAEEKYKLELKQKIEKEMREDLKKEQERKQKELQAKLEEKQKKEREQKAREEKEKEDKLRAEKEEKEAKEKEEAELEKKKQKEKMQKELEAQMKKEIEQEMRAKLAAELKAQLEKPGTEKVGAGEQHKDEAKPKIDEDAKKAKPKGKDEKKAEKGDASSSTGGKKGEAKDPFAPFGNVKEWMNAEVKAMRKKEKELFWDMVRKREEREAKAKLKATTTALQDTTGNLEPKLPPVNLDWGDVS